MIERENNRARQQVSIDSRRRERERDRIAPDIQALKLQRAAAKRARKAARPHPGAQP